MYNIEKNKACFSTRYQALLIKENIILKCQLNTIAQTIYATIDTKTNEIRKHWKIMVAL